MADRRRNKAAGILFGPLLVVGALAALWANEHRFDYHRAAAATTPVATTDEAGAGETISLTGDMDPSLTYAGEYVASFTGFLEVRRSAEIYAWDRDDSDEHVDWTLRWMSSLESNSRNSGIVQELSSNRMVPQGYRVGPLPIESDRIELVDDARAIDPASLELVRSDLRAEGDYFFLRKGDARNLGDERVRYTGVPVPPLATYFGKVELGRGVADTTHQRSGFINQIIRDTGILHHIVAGEREPALATMKAHLARLKWIVRGAGTAAVVMGFGLFFSGILGALFHVPFIGRVAEGGAFLAALALGIPLALVTMTASYLLAHPLVLGIVVGAVVLVGRATYRRGKASQEALRGDLEREHGRSLGAEELTELEFLELARMALSDDRVDPGERDFLRTWARQHRWDDATVERLIAQAAAQRGATAGADSTEEHLTNLIRLAMADGRLSPRELRTIREAANSLGYESRKVRDLIDAVRRGGSGAGRAA